MIAEHNVEIFCENCSYVSSHFYIHEYEYKNDPIRSFHSLCEYHFKHKDKRSINQVTKEEFLINLILRE